MRRPITVHDLLTNLEQLRQQRSALIDGASKLLAYGISSHVMDVFARLDILRSRAGTIADQLASLGADQHAAQAREGWDLILPPPGSDHDYR